MNTYVALLRGVNVGGNNVIAMPALKAAFEAQGFGNVRTYINSGNVIFESDCPDAGALQEVCRNLLLGIGLSVDAAVFSGEALWDALAHAPGWWGGDPGSKHNAIFAIPPATAESIVREMGEIKPEYEQAAAYGPVVFWSAPLKTFSRTRWSKIVSAHAYSRVTIRNANTARKLARMAYPQNPAADADVVCQQVGSEKARTVD